MEEGSEETVIRERFSSWKEKMLTYVAYVIGSANVILFPAMVVKHGGVVFILVYVLLTIMVGIPVSILEVTVGQYSGNTAIKAWDMAPAFRGVGISLFVISFMASIFSQMVMSQSLLYVVYSAAHPQPYAKCNPAWNVKCVDDFGQLKSKVNCSVNQSHLYSSCDCRHSGSDCNPPYHLASDIFFHDEVSNTVGTASAGPSLGISLILLFAWSVSFFCILRGVVYTSKILHVTVICPFILLIIVLIRVAIETGSSQGLSYLFNSNQWYRLKHFQIYTEALKLVLMSLGANSGLYQMLGTYNDFNDKPHRCVLLATLLDIITSVSVTFTVYLILGVSSFRAGFSDISCLFQFIHCDIDHMVFQVYPAGLILLGEEHIWSLFFYAMLFVMSMDSWFGVAETVLSFLQDDFLFVRRHNIVVRVVFAVLGFFFCLTLLLPGYGERTIDGFHKSYIFSSPVIGLAEVIGIAWFYGSNKFLEDISYMMNVKMSGPTKALLSIYTSVILPCVFTVLMVMVFMDRTSYDSISVFFILILLSPIFCWFVIYVVMFFLSHQNRQLTCGKMLKKLFEPSPRWVPNDGTNVHRYQDTVLADIFPCLLRQNKRCNIDVNLCDDVMETTSDAWDDEPTAFSMDLDQLCSDIDWRALSMDRSTDRALCLSVDRSGDVNFVKQLTTVPS